LSYGLSARGIERKRQAGPEILCARLLGHVTLEARTSGKITACFDGFSVDLGKFSAGATERARYLRAGLPLSSFAPRRRTIDKEIDRLVRRLAEHGLLEYRLKRSQSGEDQVIIEPQVADYWPHLLQFRDKDNLVLSRFAYMRRRANEMVLESPRAGALFRICNPQIAAALAILATPQPIKRLRGHNGFPGVKLLALLADCQILVKINTPNDRGLRATEGDENVVLWDFHDLLFHARSTEGRHANPAGALYPYVDVITPQPAVRPSWPGKKIVLRTLSTAYPEQISSAAKLLRERQSTRAFDDQQPITLAELSQLLDSTARVRSTFQTSLDRDGDGPILTSTVRPYPSGGGSYEFELYLAVHKCEGLERGFYHYDAGGHALVPIAVRDKEFESLLKAAALAMGESGVPQVLITIAARFGRVSWKYSSIAYALILKDVGVLIQTLYLMAGDIGLGGCAIGMADIDLFAKMTGLEFHVEGPVGQFAIGRGITSGVSR
jgi:SagB-type dehydrogenase family enzyme